MGQGLDEKELRRRAIDGVREEVEAFGSGAPDSFLVRRDGLLASVTPASPQRSLFNSVFPESLEALKGEIEELGETYDSHGVKAWTVWVRDDDRASAEWLAGRGHRLDAAPRAMAMSLESLCSEPERPEGVEIQLAAAEHWMGDPQSPGPATETGELGRATELATVASAARLNDLAYGYGPDGFRAGLAAPTAIQWSLVLVGEEPVGCVGAISVGDDCCVTGVATSPEHQGRGIAGWLLWQVLAAARENGTQSASLQATKAGAPLYERLGFADYGFIEMWELRR